MPASGLTPVARRSIVSDAREQITRLIVSGALKPGEKLPAERQLIELLGVSRPTLREGIAALTAMGILEARQGAGTFVSDLDPARIVEPLVLIVNLNSEVLRELFDVRRILESGAIQIAAEHIVDDELAELHRLLSELRAARGSLKRFMKLDIEFHRTIHRASHNELLIALLESVGHLARESRAVTSQRPTVRTQAHRDHVQIVKALEARDPLAAREAMLAHLDHMRNALDSALDAR
jgi:DNA-binding FadR family transcriptional regulator